MCRSGSARGDGESRRVILWTDRSIRSRIRRQRDQLHRVRTIRRFRSGRGGVQLAVGAIAARLRQRHGDDCVPGPHAHCVHRTARIGFDAVEGDRQSALDRRGRAGAQLERLAERHLIRCRGMTRTCAQGDAYARGDANSLNAIEPIHDQPATPQTSSRRLSRKCRTASTKRSTSASPIGSDSAMNPLRAR